MTTVLLVRFFLEQFFVTLEKAHFFSLPNFCLTRWLFSPSPLKRISERKERRKGSTKLLILFAYSILLDKISFSFSSSSDASHFLLSSLQFLFCLRRRLSLSLVSIKSFQHSNIVRMHLNQKISIFVWSNWNVKGKSSTAYIFDIIQLDGIVVFNSITQKHKRTNKEYPTIYTVHRQRIVNRLKVKNYCKQYTLPNCTINFYSLFSKVKLNDDRFLVHSSIVLFPTCVCI